MKTSSITHHRGYNGDVFYRLHEEVENLRYGVIGRRRVERQSALQHNTYECVRLTPSATTSLASATATLVAFDTVDFDLCGGYRGTSGRLYCPPDADVVRVTASVGFAASASGSIRAIQLFRDGSFYAQEGQAPLGGAFAGKCQLTRVMQVNRPSDPSETYFEIKAYQDSGGSLNALKTSEFTVEVLSRKPKYTNGKALKTIQGFTYDGEERGWDHIFVNQFNSNYGAMVAALAAFDVLSLGSVVGWGDGTDYPHPKDFEGTYSPISPDFSCGGRDARQFLMDLKAANPNIQIFLYTTPQLDHNEAAWDDATGVPDISDSWSPSYGGTAWANLINSITAMVAVGPHLFDGIYFDLCGANVIDIDKLNAAVAIAKSYGYPVMLNGVGADLSTVQFQAGCTQLSYGDYIFVEGFQYDSTNGDTATASINISSFMSKIIGRGVRLAAVVEELGDTTYAGMESGTPAVHLLNALSTFNTYYQPGWIIDHQRASYDYVGEPVA